jgi:hypothetical protein
LKPLTSVSCGLSLRPPSEIAKRMDGLNVALRGSYVNTRFVEELNAQSMASGMHLLPLLFILSMYFFIINFAFVEVFDSLIFRGV